jgi:hypothetical protein
VNKSILFLLAPYHSESDEESEESREGPSDTSSISSSHSLPDEQAASKSTHSPQHGEKTLVVEPQTGCQSAGNSPTTGRRRQGTVVAPGVKITITEDGTDIFQKGFSLAYPIGLEAFCICKA